MWKKVLFGLSLLLGLGGFCAIPIIVGVDETLGIIGHVGIPCILAYFGLCLCTIVFPAVAWWILLRAENIRVSPLDAIRANFMGFPINFCTPSMYLGSEPLKVFYLARITGAQKRRILATVIVNKFQELVGLVLLIVLSAVFFVWNTEIFQQRDEVILIVVTLVLAGLLGLLFYAFVGNFRPTVRLINLLARMGVARRKLARLRGKAEEMEQMVHAAFTLRWRRFLLAQCITLVSAVAILLRPVVFLLFLREIEVVELHHVAAIYVIMNLVNMVTIIPGSLGIFEGGIVAYFAECPDLNAEQGTALTLVNRIADIALLVIGGWLIVHHGLTGVARGREKVEMRDEGNGAGSGRAQDPERGG